MAPPTPTCVDPLAGLVLPPRLDDADRAEILREMTLAGDALWVRVLMQQSAVVEAVRRGQGVMQVPVSSTLR